MNKIYKIIDNTNGNIYVGSTKSTLKLRLQNHVRHYKQSKKTTTTSDKKKNVFCSSFDIIKNENYAIELIEEGKFNIKEREQYYIDNLDCVNKYNAIKDKDYKKNWYIKNKDQILTKQKHYAEDNADKIKEYQKKYIEDNKDKIKIKQTEWLTQNKDKKKETDKQYYEQNRERIIERQRQYKEANRERINEKARQQRQLKKEQSTPILNVAF